MKLVETSGYADCLGIGNFFIIENWDGRRGGAWGRIKIPCPQCRCTAAWLRIGYESTCQACFWGLKIGLQALAHWKFDDFSVFFFASIPSLAVDCILPRTGLTLSVSVTGKVFLTKSIGYCRGILEWPDMVGWWLADGGLQHVIIEKEVFWPSCK